MYDDGLTKRQRKILEIVKRLQPTTVREVQKAAKIANINGAFYHIQRLRRKGFIPCRGKSDRRSIRASKGILLLGKIT